MAAVAMAAVAMEVATTAAVAMAAAATEVVAWVHRRPALRLQVPKSPSPRCRLKPSAHSVMVTAERWPLRLRQPCCLR